MVAEKVVFYGLVSEPCPAGRGTSDRQIINLDAGFAVDSMYFAQHRFTGSTADYERRWPRCCVASRIEGAVGSR